MKLVAIVGTNAKNHIIDCYYNTWQDICQKADIEILEITDVPMFNETDDQTESAIIQEFNSKSQKRTVLSLPHLNTTTRFLQA